MRRLLPLLVVAVLALPPTAFALISATKLGTTGPGFTITLKKAGVKVKTLKPGAYTITVSDKSTQHDFVPQARHWEENDHRVDVQGHEDGDGDAEARDLHVLLHAAQVDRHEGHVHGQVVPAVRRLVPRSRGPTPKRGSGSSRPVMTRAAYSASAGPCLKPARTAAQDPFVLGLRPAGDHEVRVARQRVLADGRMRERASRSAGKRSAR